MPDQLQTIVQRMIDAGEPEENIATVIQHFKSAGNPQPLSSTDLQESPTHAAVRGFGEGAIGGLTGFAKGVGDKVLHPLDTAVGLIKGTASEVGSTLLGAGRLATDPVATLSNAGTAIKQAVTEDIPNAVGDQLNLAGRDPEAFGREVGHTTADLDTGIALGGGARFLPRPVGRTVGGLMEAVGKKAEWPIRMMGAHQLGSGNPMGLLTVGTPELLKIGGQRLGQWGRAEPAYMAREIEGFQGSVGPPILDHAKPEVRINAPHPDDELGRMGTDAYKPVPKGPQSGGATVDPDAAAIAEAQRLYPGARIKSGSVAPVATVKGSLTPPAPTRVPIRIAPDTMQRLEKTPVTDALATTSRGTMSATPGLTIEDAKALGINPNVRITGLTPEAIQRLLAERAGRAQMYRTNAGLDAGFTRATEE